MTNSNFFTKVDWGIIAAILVFIVATIVCGFNILPQTNGELVYTLDDAYIHLSVAKNFVQSGTWGIDSQHFTSASSSPLWVVLLSMLYVFVPVKELPFALNFVLILTLLLRVHYQLREFAFTTVVRFTLLMAVVFTTSVFSIMWSGMEHILHLLLLYEFLKAVQNIANKQSQSAASLFHVALLAALCSATRIESLAAICVIVFFMMVIPKSMSRFERLRLAIVLLTSGFIPWMLVGGINILNGEMFLPNSIVVKLLDSVSEQSSFFGLVSSKFVKVHKAMREYPALLFCLQASLLTTLITVVKRKDDFWKKQLIVSSSIPFIIVAHLFVGELGWFYRYEAYLIGITLLFSIPLLIKSIEEFVHNYKVDDNRKPLVQILVASTILLFMHPLLTRASVTWKAIESYSTLIYQMQTQSSTFLATYYPKATVAVSDIGAVSYFSTTSLIDIYGLADGSIAKAKASKSWNVSSCLEYLQNRNTEFAITYPSVFEKMRRTSADSLQLNNLQEVAYLQTSSTLAINEPRVSFYSLNAQRDSTLIQNLTTFSLSLPQGVSIVFKEKGLNPAE